MSDQEIKIATAPLKVILFGEHAVLDGGPCIAVSIAVSSTATLMPGDGAIEIIDLKKEVYQVEEVLEMCISNKKIRISLDSPLGCGLGTSASISLLISACVIADSINYDNSLYDYKNNSLKRRIKSIADTLETRNHCVSSGVDVCTILNGDLIYFIQQEVVNINSKFLKKFKILLYYSGIKKHTAEVVKRLMNDEKEYVYEKIKQIASKAKEVMENEFSLVEIYALIRENQDCLEELGIVPDSMKNEVYRLREMGIESKITGSGGGGCLVTIVEKDKEIYGWESVEIDEDGLKFYNLEYLSNTNF